MVTLGAKELYLSKVTTRIFQESLIKLNDKAKYAYYNLESDPCNKMVPSNNHSIIFYYVKL